jgi:hypothetical protein
VPCRAAACAAAPPFPPRRIANTAARQILRATPAAVTCCRTPAPHLPALVITAFSAPRLCRRLLRKPAVLPPPPPTVPPHRRTAANLLSAPPPGAHHRYSIFVSLCVELYRWERSHSFVSLTPYRTTNFSSLFISTVFTFSFVYSRCFSRSTHSALT